MILVRVVNLKPINSKTKKTIETEIVTVDSNSMASSMSVTKKRIETEIETVHSDLMASLMSESETKKTIGMQIGTVDSDAFKEFCPRDFRRSLKGPPCDNIKEQEHCNKQDVRNFRKMT